VLYADDETAEDKEDIDRKIASKEDGERVL
jgi:hypothetical protein